MNLGIVVLNYNNAKDTIHCVNSLLAAEGAEDSFLLIVDNHSTDGSYEEIIRYFSSSRYRVNELQRGTTDQRLCRIPALNILRTRENRGYAAGNNAGLRYLLAEPTVNYCWILNNDTEVKSDCINAICRFISNPPAQLGIAATLLADFRQRDRLQALCARYYPSVGKTRLLYERAPLASMDKKKIDAAVATCDYLIGASLVINKHLLHEVGLFNESFFLYGEEIDLVKRAKAAKWNLEVIPDAIVFHKEGGSTGATKDGKKDRQPFFEYHSCRSKLIYTGKYYWYFYPLILCSIGLNLLWVYRFNFRKIFQVLRYNGSSRLL